MTYTGLATVRYLWPLRLLVPSLVAVLGLALLWATPAHAADAYQHDPLVEVQHVFGALEEEAADADPHATLAPIETTLDDFRLPGTQPNTLTNPLADSASCGGCHVEHIVNNYAGSIMANSARDPLFRAALQVANQDAEFGGELCIRCHSPNAWLNGRATPSDGSAINAEDLQGVSCSTCHRVVPPTATAGEAARDAGERAAISGTPILGSGAYIIDRQDFRRGPFAVNAPHGTAETTYMRSSEMCATCHDIDNPLLTYDTNSGEFRLNGLGQPAGAGDRLFPVERTYSEWKASAFGKNGVVGLDYPGLKRKTNTEDGPITVCQDCHMPMIASPIAFGGPQRTLGQHQWAGGSAAWQAGIDALWKNVSADTRFDSAQTLNNATLGKAMLGRAADLELNVIGNKLQVKIINNTGHKLPTGYAEGRRMWLEVTAYNGTSPLYAYGVYANGEIINPVKIYEIKQGISEAHAQEIGQPELAGEGFHFILNNQVFKDNRIPPRGFTNAELEARDAGSVGASYPDGQYWDTATFPLPPETTQISVTLHYQTASGEYLDFLEREANLTVNDAVLGPTNWGQVVGTLRLDLNLEQPVRMTTANLTFGVRYVATTGSDTNNQCGNPAQPCLTINHAVSVANPQDQIRVATGVYQEAVIVNKRLTLLGGFTTANWETADWEANPTILDGAGVSRPLTILGNPADYTVVNGFVVRNGNANSTTQKRGGGIYLGDFISFATVENVRLENNLANQAEMFQGGGGLAAEMGNTFLITANLVISNVTAITNTGSSQEGGSGGGLLINAVGNSALDVTMERLTLTGNTSGASFGSNGGGMALSLNGGTATLRNARIVGNRTTSTAVDTGTTPSGGGIALSNGTLIAQNVLIARNSAQRGGGLWVETGNTPAQLIFDGVTIADNDQGPGLARDAIGTVTNSFSNTLALSNTLISGNAVAFEGLAMSLSTAAVDLAGVLVADDVTTVFSGTVTSGDTPLRGTAGYANAATGDYHLTTASDALDQGVNTGLSTDLDGTPRPQGPGVDIGAFELVTTPPSNQTITFEPLLDREVTESPFTVTATASSGLPVTFTSLTPAVCTINGTTVTLVTTGTCTIRASQAGNANFNPAPDVERSFAVVAANTLERLYLPVVRRS